MRTIILALGLHLAAFGNTEAGMGMGVYLDEMGEINCAQSIDSFPVALELYLLVTGCDDTTNIAGWEAALSFSPDCVLVASDLGGGEINLLQPPEYMVAYGEALVPQNSVITLARFEVLIFAPVEFYLHSVSSDVEEGELGPSLVDSNGRYLDFHYSYGSPFHPVLTVGETDCPQFVPVIAEPILARDHPWELLESGIGNEMSVTMSDGYRQSGRGKDEAEFDLSYIHDKTDVGVWGIVVEVEAECRAKEGLPYGLLRMEIECDQVFWGPQVDNLVVWVDGLSVSGCVEYGEGFNSDKLESINTGDSLFVAGWYSLGVVQTNSEFVVHKSLQEIQDDLEELGGHRGMLDKTSYRNRIHASEVVALVEPVSLKDKTFRAIIVFRGDACREGDRIVIDDWRFCDRILRYKGENDGILCVLQDDGGKYKLTTGQKGCLFVQKGYLQSAGGVPYRHTERWGLGDVRN